MFKTVLRNWRGYKKALEGTRGLRKSLAAGELNFISPAYLTLRSDSAATERTWGKGKVRELFHLAEAEQKPPAGNWSQTNPS